MRSVRLTTVALLLVVVAVVAALVAGTHQSRENEKRSKQASAEHDVAVSSWPRSFQRVPNASTSCEVDAPSICLYSEENTEQVSAKVAVTIGSSVLEKNDVKGAPATYSVRGTIGNDRTPVVVTVTAHPAPGTTAAKPKYAGSDVTVSLDQPSS